MCCTVVLDLGDWELCETVVVVLPHACFRAFLVVPCARVLLLIGWYMQGIQASYDEQTALVKSGKFRVTEALVHGWWSSEDRCGEDYHVNSSLT